MERQQPDVAARDLVRQQFPNAVLAVLAGSAAAGLATDTSDLDIVVVLDGPPAPYRETLRHDGWIVEVFAHTPDSLTEFYASERTLGHSTLAHMLTTGLVLTDTTDGALRRDAQAVIDAGPEPLTDADRDRRRYMLTADLDDLTDATDPGERAAIAAHVVGQATDLYLRANGQWSGYGKWGHRHVVTANPALAERLTGGLGAALAGNTAPLVTVAAEVLDLAGGALADGYVAGRVRSATSGVDAAPTLIGRRVTLRGPRPGDEAPRQALGWHASIERGYGHTETDRPMPDAEANDWYAYVSAQSDTYWVAEADGDLIGVAFLHSLSDADRKARYAIGLFAPQHLGHGYGTEITRLVLDHAFGALNLHRVDLRVLEFNAAAIACYQRVGFQIEGRERESCLLDGQWHDDLIMGILAAEYLAAAR